MIDRSDPRWAAYVAMTEALIEDFRAHNGEVTSGPFAGRTVLLLTTIGAKSGKPRLAPLIYTLAGDGLRYRRLERWVAGEPRVVRESRRQPRRDCRARRGDIHRPSEGDRGR